jgi:outer membrane protein assembly factor BamE (lipoprotein component of BamABCDE complex)
MQEPVVSAIARPFLVFLLAATSVTSPSLVHPGDSTPFQLAQGFSSWRPYANPNRLISVGMNKGEVLAIAGTPNHEESYYQSAGGRLVRVSDWYYIQTGLNPETTLLKFVQENLVSITSTPTR